MKEWLYSTDLIKEEDCIYDLRAICNHAGSSSGGHYYCYAVDENDGVEVWNEYNDSSVFPILENNLIRESAYVLFYQRRSSHLSTKQMIESFESKWISNPTTITSPISSYHSSSYWNSTSRLSPDSSSIGLPNVDNTSINNHTSISVNNTSTNTNSNINNIIIENKSDPITGLTEENLMNNELDMDDEHPSNKPTITVVSESDDNIDNLYISFVCLSFLSFYACIF